MAPRPEDANAFLVEKATFGYCCSFSAANQNSLSSKPAATKRETMMNSHSKSGRQDARSLIRLAIYVFVLHSIFLAYDCATNFASFYRVDRSDNRVDAMHRMLGVHTASELGD